MFKPFHSHVHEYASPGEGNYKFLERKCCQMATGQKNYNAGFSYFKLSIRFGLFMRACLNHFIATYMSMHLLEKAITIFRKKMLSNGIRTKKNVMPDFPILNEGLIFIGFGSFTLIYVRMF